MMLPSVSRMTPEPRPSPSLVETVTVTTEGRHFAATAWATVASSVLALMLMVWPALESEVARLPLDAEPEPPITPVPSRAATMAPVASAPATPPATIDLSVPLPRLGLPPLGSCCAAGWEGAW